MKFRLPILLSSITINLFISLSLVFTVMTNSALAQMFDEDDRFGMFGGDNGFNVTGAGDSKDVELIGRALVEGPPYAVFVKDNLAYLCAGYALVILDISNPTQPVKLGLVELPGSAQDVYVLGNYAYVADWYGLRIIDVSDLSSPYEVGFYDTAGYALGVFVLGNYAYVAETGTLPLSTLR